MAYAAPVPSSPPVASANYANSAGSANTANYANTAGYAETGGLPSVNDLQAANPNVNDDSYYGDVYNPTGNYVEYGIYCSSYYTSGVSRIYTYNTTFELIQPYGLIGYFNNHYDDYCIPSPISVFSSN